MLAEELRQAGNLIRAGRSAEARPVLARYLQQHPDSEEGWLLLSMVLRDRTQQIDCLDRVLKINPSNGLARERLAQFRVAGQPPPATPPSEHLDRAPQAGSSKPSTPPAPAAPAKPAPAKLEKPAPGAKLERPAKPGEQPGKPWKVSPPVSPAAKPRRGARVLWIALLVLLTLAAQVVGFVRLSFLQTLSPARRASKGTPLGQPLHLVDSTLTPRPRRYRAPRQPRH
jgi:hypothetical protein